MDSLKIFNEKFKKGNDSKPSTKEEIELLESELQIKLPNDYKNFIQEYGDIWTPDILDVILDNELELNDVSEFWNIERIIYDKKNEWTSKLDVDLIPFASDSMGNIFAFSTGDLTTNNENSTVYFFDHDYDTINKISDSFTDWLARFNEVS